MDSKGNKNDRNEKSAGLVCDLLTVCDLPTVGDLPTVCDLPTVGDLPTCFYDLRQSTSSLACDLRSKCIKKPRNKKTYLFNTTMQNKQCEYHLKMRQKYFLHLIVNFSRK